MDNATDDKDKQDPVTDNNPEPQGDDQTSDGTSDADRNGMPMEPLTLDELDAFMRRAKERAADLTLKEQALRDTPSEPIVEEAVTIDPAELAALRADFFPELPHKPPPRRLVQGVIIDFDNTLARPSRPLEELRAAGAQQAEAYLRSTGMTDLPADFWESIVEARLFAETKSDDENEEHVADDALSFLLQFFGYPASRMDPDILRRAVDIFYAPEMVVWEPLPGAHTMLADLVAQEIKIAVVANFSCDRVFQRMIDYTGLRPYLDLCLCSASVEWRKPAEQIYGVVLERWDVEAYEVICVGDSLKHDVAGGLTIGAQTVHCRMLPLPEDQRIVDAVIPDAVIDELGELSALVRAWS